MKLKRTRMPIAEAYTQQIRYTLPHKTLIVTIAVIPQPNQPPLVYITNETDQIHQRPRCIRTSAVLDLARCYSYDRACIDIHDEKRYEVDCFIVVNYPQPPIRPEHYLTDEPLRVEHSEPYWTVHARLIECREIRADNDSDDTTRSETDTP